MLAERYGSDVERAPAGRHARRRKTTMVERFRQREVGGDRRRRKEIYVHVGNDAVWKGDRGSTMWKYDDCENVDKKSNTGAERDRSNRSSCGQLLKSLKWRDRSHTESEAKIDDESKARLCDDTSQRDNAKKQRYHRSVAAWLRNNHGTTIAENPLPSPLSSPHTHCDDRWVRSAVRRIRTVRQRPW